MDQNRNKIAVVTGATSGIGKASATGLARLGFTVAVLSRECAEGEAAVAEIKKATGNANVDLIVCDLSSLASVRAAAAEIEKRFPKLDILINNAAVFKDKRIVTADGLELMFATNYLGHFLLTNLLIGALRAAAPSRVINMTAPSTTAPFFKDLQGEKSFSPIHAFGASKAENLLFTYAMARQLKGSGIIVNAYFPGVTRTNLMKNAPLPLRFVFGFPLRPFVRSAERSARGVVELATSAMFNNTTGELVHDGKVIKAPFQSEVALQERLWAESRLLVGPLKQIGDH